MIWEIKEKQNTYWYKSDLCELKIINSENKTNIFLNYKDYNIIMPMEMWGFCEEVTERNIRYDIEGDNIGSWYYVIEKKNLRLFIDLIYYFIKEHNADKLINPKLIIKEWN
ncbi:MAG: hypothetical protein AAGU14_10640 [Eubacteriaceae bacterium]